jgi:hypothetical protein
MVAQAVTSINCPNCGTPFTAPVQQIIDAQADPEAKTMLLSGQLNTVVCPSCGFRGALNTPFLYHDAELELALVYMPMELGATDLERQKAIGDLTNRLMQQLPAEARKGYLLQPRTFLTVENLLDALLEKDEATRELLEAQERRIELLEELRQLDPEDTLALAEFAGSHDDEIDVLFFQILDVVTSIGEQEDAAGDMARLRRLRDILLEKTTAGRSLLAQQQAVEALNADPTRATLIEQLVATDDDIVREALVTVGRQLLDYAFFQELTARIDAAESAGDAALREKLVALRRQVQDIRDEVDMRAAAVLTARAQLLRNLLLEEDPKEVLQRHVSEIDEAFFGVLATNIEQAEQEGRQDVVARLRSIGDMAVQLLNEFLPQDIRLVNQLASAQSDEQIRQLLEDERESLSSDFLQLLESAVAELEQSERSAAAGRLRYAAEQTKLMLAQ